MRYTGMVDCFVKVVRHEGVRALFHGLSANYVKVAPSHPPAFVTYEEIKKILGWSSTSARADARRPGRARRSRGQHERK